MARADRLNVSILFCKRMVRIWNVGTRSALCDHNCHNWQRKWRTHAIIGNHILFSTFFASILHYCWGHTELRLWLKNILANLIQYQFAVPYNEVILWCSNCEQRVSVRLVRLPRACTQRLTGRNFSLAQVVLCMPAPMAWEIGSLCQPKAKVSFYSKE